MLDPEHPIGGPRDDAAADGPRAQVERFLGDVRDAFELPQASRRLSLSGVRVQIDVTDADVSLTLLLDRLPPEALLGTVPERPTVRLVLPAADLGAILADGSHLPMRILAGDVQFEGSARKFLRVLPILRHAAEQARADTEG